MIYRAGRDQGESRPGTISTHVGIELRSGAGAVGEVREAVRRSAKGRKWLHPTKRALGFYVDRGDVGVRIGS